VTKKRQYDAVHSICAIGQFFMSLPKIHIFFGSTIRRARHPAAALQKWGASTQAKRVRAETPTFEGNIGKRPSQHHLHAEFACDQFESVEPTKHFPSPHPLYTNGDHFGLDRCLGLPGHPFSPSPRCRQSKRSQYRYSTINIAPNNSLFLIPKPCLGH
jgi:hypothetical protein